MGMREKPTPMHFECARMPVALSGRRFNILNQFPVGWIQAKTPDFRVVRGSGMTERTASLEGHPADGDEGGEGIIERYRRGEVDLQTVLANLPESGVPPFILAAYNALIANRSGPDTSEAQEKKQRDERYERFVEVVEQWRIDRGQEYVDAYLQLKKTGSAIEEGQRLIESDWFRALQNTRAETIRRLEEKSKEGPLASDEAEELLRNQQALSGDEAVAKNWKTLAEDYRAVLARENTGGMTEREVLEKEAAAKARIFEELDKASPELRERLLAEMERHDPSIRMGYHTHLNAAHDHGPVLPETPPLSAALAEASANGDLEAGLFDDEILSGGITASAAPTSDFNRAAALEGASPALATSDPHTAARSSQSRRGPGF